MEQIEFSETSTNINQTPGKHPKVSTLDNEHGESLKSRILYLLGSWSKRCKIMFLHGMQIILNTLCYLSVVHLFG
jgi:hypothetical protein